MQQLTQTKSWMTANPTLAFWLKVVIGANLIALFAQITVPMYPVPMTGQTLAISVVALGLGRKAGFSAVLFYLFEGAMGLPVFANGGAGLATFAGPSGGYLIGFAASAYVLGYFSDKGVLKSFPKTVLVTILAAAVMYAFGLAQLAFFVPADKVLAYGLYPFILGGIVKAILAGILVVPTHKFFSKI